MKQRQIMWIFAALFACSCVVAWLAVFGRPGGDAPVALTAKPALPSVIWRVPLGARAGRPCACADGWVVADAAGGVTKVTLEGRVRWRAGLSNEVFAGAAELVGGRVAVASESGRVFCLDGATGETLWKRETEARFQHAPLAGLRGAESVLWLVSQEDGRLFCLRVRDGSVLWTAEATNRCDGEPVAWPGRVAYGNCDGAVYVFDSLNGKLLGSVEVGADDQMAGGILILDDGRLVTGTRSGHLVLVNPETRLCEASVKVSESEAFVTPAACFLRQIAMGSEEGDVTLWLREAKVLRQTAHFATGAAVKGLAFANGRLFFLSGGSLGWVDSPAGEVARLPLGDDVGGLAVNAAGDVVCVADGAVVCVKGGRR